MSTGIASIFLTLFSEWPRPQLVSLDPIDLDLELAKYCQLISDATIPTRPQAAFDDNAQQIPSPDDWPIWRLPVEVTSLPCLILIPLLKLVSAGYGVRSDCLHLQHSSAR